MVDTRIEKLAELLVNYSLDLQRGNKFFIWSGMAAAPLVEAVYKQAIDKGAFPFIMWDFPAGDEYRLKYGNDEQVQHIPEPAALLYQKYDRMLRILAEENTKALSSVDPAKIAMASKARGPLLKTYMERTARGEMKWSLTAFPTNAYAQDADMSLAEYADFVYGACMPDQNDPVGYWTHISQQQERIIAWLKGKKNVHLVGKGTDLRLSIDGRTFINCDCRVNVPDGEIFTGPVEDSIEGHVSFSYPTIYMTREVTGVQLEFKKGRVVEASATKNQDFLLRTLDTDEGSRSVGEFAIGTNEGIQKFTRQILFDEKIGGSFHMALGAGYPESGSKAQSAIHWDMICDLRDGFIKVDGETLYENGKFVI
jgi:aminopeptidase